MAMDPLKEVINILNTYLDGKYKIDPSVITAMAADIVKTLGTPEKKGIGSCVMTAEASYSADRVRKGEIKPHHASKPTVF